MDETVSYGLILIIIRMMPVRVTVPHNHIKRRGELPIAESRKRTHKIRRYGNMWRDSFDRSNLLPVRFPSMRKYPARQHCARLTSSTACLPARLFLSTAPGCSLPTQDTGMPERRLLDYICHCNVSLVVVVHRSSRGTCRSITRRAASAL